MVPKPNGIFIIFPAVDRNMVLLGHPIVRTNSWDMRDSGVPSEVLVRAVSFMIQHVGRMNLATCHADWRKHLKAALHVRMGEYFSR